MKKYFIIESPEIKEHYATYLADLEKQRLLFREMAKRYGISAKEFYVTEKQFMIVINKTDQAKFKDQLLKEVYSDGLVKFRESSEIGKAWKKRAAEEKIKRVDTVILMWLLRGKNLSGRSRQNIFEIYDTLYGSLDLPHDFEIDPGQVTEIKASNYHKIIEDYNQCQEESK